MVAYTIIASNTFYGHNLVFYNGTKELSDCVELKLSDAFDLPSSKFEWTAVMLNINPGHNVELLNSCRSLKDYSTYVSMVEENRKQGMLPEKAVIAATRQAGELNLLDGFFCEHESEVLEMVLTEYNQKLHEQTLLAEGREEGREEGISIALFNIAVNLLKRNMPDEDILAVTGMSSEQLEEARKQAGF